jgi:hypothetical protein
MFDDAPFLVRVLFIYLNDSRSSQNLSAGRGTPARTSGNRISIVLLCVPSVPSSRMRYPEESRIDSLTRYGAQFFEDGHRSALSRVDLRPSDVFGMVSR